MAVRVRREIDPVLSRVRNALRVYGADHQRAKIDMYRRNPVAIRIRIVDPDLSALDRIRRHDLIWSYLASLPEDTLFHVSLALMLTPDELCDSIANLEFEREFAKKRKRATASKSIRTPTRSRREST